MAVRDSGKRMSTGVQVFLLIIVATVFLVRLTVQLYRARTERGDRR